MLNGYHHQLLKCFADFKVRFLVIGGQARYLTCGIATSDLDIWVDISQKHKKALWQALLSWIDRYPSHTTQHFSCISLLRPNVQIHFPEVDACYLTEAGEIAEIPAGDGIDILTSIESHDFEEYFYRAEVWEADGVSFRYIEISSHT